MNFDFVEGKPKGKILSLTMQDLRIGGELRKKPEELLALEGVFQYSPDPQKDLNLQMLVAGPKDSQIVEKASLTHVASK